MSRELLDALANAGCGTCHPHGTIEPYYQHGVLNVRCKNCGREIVFAAGEEAEKIARLLEPKNKREERQRKRKGGAA